MRGVAYMGDHAPVKIMKGGDVFWEPTEASGTEFDGSYNHTAEVSVAGESVQKTLTGKNIANPADMSNNVRNYTNGEPYTNIKYWGNSVLIEASGAVSLSYEYTGSSNAWCAVTHYDSNGAKIGSSSSGYSRTGIASNVAGTAFVSFVLWDGTDMRADTLPFKNIQLELGSTATAYEPYCGGVPSPNPDYPQPIESVDSVGLVSKDGMTLGGVAISTSANPVIYDIPLVHVGDKYTITQFNGTRERVQINLYKDGVYKDYWTPNPVDRVITANMEFNQIAWVTKQDSEYQGLVDAGTYCTFAMGENPGKAALRTIDLQGHQLCSLPDGTKDELIVHMDGRVDLVQKVGKMVIDGRDANHPIYQYGSSSSWPAGHAKFYVRNIPTGFKPFAIGGETPAFHAWRSNMFSLYKDFNQTSTETNAFVQYPTILYFSVLSSFASTVEELAARLNEKPLEIYAALAEPQTIALPSIDPIPTYWPTTIVYDQNGNDITAYVKVVA